MSIVLITCFTWFRIEKMLIQKNNPFAALFPKAKRLASTISVT